MNKGQMNTLRGPSASEQVAALEQRLSNLEADYSALQQERDALAQRVEALRQERDQAYRMISGIDAALNGSPVPTGCHSQASMGAAELNERTREAEAALRTAQQDAARLREALVIADTTAANLHAVIRDRDDTILAIRAVVSDYGERGSSTGQMFEDLLADVRAALTAPAGPTETPS